MPTNPHLIPMGFRDAGTAGRVLDVAKQAGNATKQQVPLGEGVRIVGGLIETSADQSVPRAFMVGSVWAGDDAVDGLPVGIYVTSGGGDQRCVDIVAGEGILVWEPDGSDVAVAILPDVGVSLHMGQNQWNNISWAEPTTSAKAAVGAYTDPGESGFGPSASVRVFVTSPNGHNSVGFIMETPDDLADEPRGTSFSGQITAEEGIGMFTKHPPTSQPSTPRTDTDGHFQADVIALLQSYGMCA